MSTTHAESQERTERETLRELLGSHLDTAVSDRDGCWCDSNHFPCFDCYQSDRREIPGDTE